MQLPSKKINIILAIVLLIIIAAVIYTGTQKEPELPKMTVQEKKARFRALILPAIDNVYAALMVRYNNIKAAIDAGETNAEIEKLKIEYKATSNDQLLMALKPHSQKYNHRTSGNREFLGHFTLF